MAFLNGRFGGDGGVGSEYLSGLLAGLNTDQATETPPPAVMSVGLPQLPPQYPETGDGGAAGMGGMLGGLLGKMGGLFGGSDSGGSTATPDAGAGGGSDLPSSYTEPSGGIGGSGGDVGGDIGGSTPTSMSSIDDPGLPKQSHYLNAFRRVYG